MTRFSRRQFLRSAAAGAAVASVAPLRHVLAADSSPCRFLFVLEGNCYEPRTVLSPEARAALDDGAVDGGAGGRWWHRSYRNDSTLDIATPDLGSAPGLAGLDEFGLADRATVLFGLSSRIVGGGHSGYHGTLSSARTLNRRAGGPTIDAYLSRLEAVRGETPFDAIRLAVTTGSALNFGACAAKEGLSVPLIGNPASAYDLLYGAFGGEAEAAFNRQARLLAFLDADVQAAVLDERLAVSEVAKLRGYGASIDDLQLTQDRLRSMSVTPPAAPEGDLSPIPRLGAHLDLAASALIDGLTNVAVVGSGVGGGFSLRYSSVSGVGRHDMHHGSGGDAGLREAIATVTRLQFREIARVAKRLADTPEPDGGGSMLDHTVIVFVGDNGEQHHSTASEFPVVLLGGQARLAAGGRTLVFPRSSSDGHRQLSNLWNTLGHMVGDELNEFGNEGPQRRAPGPLMELLS